MESGLRAGTVLVAGCRWVSVGPRAQPSKSAALTSQLRETLPSFVVHALSFKLVPTSLDLGVMFRFRAVARIVEDDPLRRCVEGKSMGEASVKLVGGKRKGEDPARIRAQLTKRVESGNKAATSATSFLMRLRYSRVMASTQSSFDSWYTGTARLLGLKKYRYCLRSSP